MTNLNAVVSSTGRRHYCFFLCVAGALKSCISESWDTQEEMIKSSAGMQLAASLYNKTAAVVVYELCQDDRFYFIDSRNFPTNKKHLIPKSFSQNEPPVGRINC